MAQKRINRAYVVITNRAPLEPRRIDIAPFTIARALRKEPGASRSHHPTLSPTGLYKRLSPVELWCTDRQMWLKT
ncbi:unnamed protein product, partial [Iphiclides podalirius]